MNATVFAPRPGWPLARAPRLSALLLLFAVLTAASAGAIRVRADAPGPAHDGASWNTAFQTIQAGIDAAAGPADEVWVAAGTYKERVVQPLGVRLLGGFAGTEASSSDRVPSANVTMIDAEGAGPAVRIAGGLVGASEATVDGFLLLHGTPAGLQGDTTEGATTCSGNLIRDCQAGIILANRAVITANTIHANVADGISLAAGATADSVIRGNTISSNGLHAIRDGMSTTIADNTIDGNGGNGIESIGHSNVTNCAIRWNLIGVHATDGSLPGTTVTRCLISENYVAGISADQESYLDVLSNVVSMNKGVGIEHSNGGAVRDNVVWANIDGMRVHDPTVVTGNTVVANVGTGIDIVVAGGAVANNVVAFNDQGVRVAARDPGWPLDFRHNDVFGNKIYNLDLGPVQDITDGNIAADPLFVDAANGNLRLTPGSPCLNAGDDSAAAGALDLDGRPRIAGAHVDMGAYEYNETPDVIRVAATAPGPTHDGTSWATAYTSVRDALSSAAPSDELWVALGTYAIPVTLTGVAMYGGFAGTEATREERNWAKNISHLSQGVTLTGAMGLIDGFSITGDVTCNGLGVRLANTYLRGSLSSGQLASVEVDGCRLLGGGISAPLASWLSVVGSVITDSPGRGVSGYGDMAARVTGNRLLRCHGGGIYLHTSGRPVIAGNTIQDCQADEGAAIWCGGDNVDAHDNLLTRNQATGRGGAVYLATGTFTLENNTIVSNSATGGGGGITIAPALPLIAGTLANNIVAFNSSGIRKDGGADPMMSHNDVFGSTGDDFTGLANPTGTGGNISVDPLLVNRQQGNYHLAAASPCIDTGDNAFAVGATDFEGDPRIRNGTVDIGADETAPAAYSLDDVIRAARIAAGLEAARAGDIARLDGNAGSPRDGKVSLEDAAGVARALGGTEPDRAR